MLCVSITMWGTTGDSIVAAILISSQEMMEHYLNAHYKQGPFIITHYFNKQHELNLVYPPPKIGAVPLFANNG